MKYLALDYGKKKIGLATGNTNISIAFPYNIIFQNNLQKTIEEVINIIKKENIDERFFQ